MELKSMQQHSQNNSTVLVFQKYPPEVINSAVTPYNHLSHQSKKAKNKNIFVTLPRPSEISEKNVST